MTARPIPEPRTLQHVVSCFNGVHIAVFGDLMLDRFVEGAVTRISPEAPIPVFRATRQRTMLGGAGNVARNVASLGGSATLVGLVGADDPARELVSLAEADASLSCLAVPDDGRRTTVKTRFIAQGQHVLRVDEEDTHPASGNQVQDLLAGLERVLPAAPILVLSDYAKGVLTADTTATALALARRHGARIVVDPKCHDLARYAGADVLTPNIAEAAAVTGIACHDDAEAERAGRRIADQTGCRAVVLTRGAAGITVVERDATVHLPTQARDVFDVSGAGDTVVAALALALAAGATVAQAARLANLAAGIAVGRVGTAAVTSVELQQALERARLETVDGKLADRAAALVRIEAWRRTGQRVVFTNGCFDLLHPGHIALLRFAAAAGNRLVVGLNADASVRRLKGPTRPIQDETARAAVLAALDCVDLVVPFAEDTPLELIEALCPDVLVKGADYTVDAVVGGDFVCNRGGQVLLAPLIAGHSTTGLAKRLTAGDGDGG